MMAHHVGEDIQIELFLIVWGCFVGVGLHYYYMALVPLGKPLSAMPGLLVLLSAFYPASASEPCLPIPLTCS